MGRIPSKNPPTPIGQETINIYDLDTWRDAIDGAAEWSVDIGLYIHFALRAYIRRGVSRKRFARWRFEQDMKDPDMKVIHDFLHAGESEPEFMSEKYLPKSKRGTRAK